MAAHDGSRVTRTELLELVSHAPHVGGVAVIEGVDADAVFKLVRRCGDLSGGAEVSLRHGPCHPLPVRLEEVMSTHRLTNERGRSSSMSVS